MDSEGTRLEDVPGVGPAAATRLREHHIVNAEYLARQSYTTLAWTTKLGEVTCCKIVKNAREMLGYTLQNGLEIANYQQECLRLETGVETLDRKIIGGFPKGSLIEVHGPSRGGKSHLMHHMAVRAQLPVEQGGLATKVLWLMTGQSFRPLSIRAAALRYGLDSDITLNNILVHEVINREHFKDILKLVPEMIAESGARFIVIDSFGGLFQVEYSSMGQRENVEKELAGVMHSLRDITRASDSICFFTNQVFTAITSYGGNPNAPMNGHIIRHGSDYRFFLRIGAQGRRKMSLRAAPDIPAFDVELEIGWGGFFADKTSKRATEQEIYPKLDLHPKTTSSKEGVMVID